MPDPSTPALGPKLQKLVDAGCLTQQSAQNLTTEKRTAVEALSHAQIGTLIDTYEAVGPVFETQLI